MKRIGAVVAVAALGIAAGPIAEAAAAQFAVTSCIVRNAQFCSSPTSIPANADTHSLNYTVKAIACPARMEIKDAATQEVVKVALAAPGAIVSGTVPEAGDPPGGLWGEYYVTVASCGNGSRAAINS